MKLVNYHTHTDLCDGRNTPEEVVLTAIERGFSELGFSGHSYVEIQDFGMRPEALARYKSEISRLKEKYKDKIKIYMGIELDYFSELDTLDFDYVIGSVHLLMRDGKKLDIDLSEACLAADAQRYFGGDFIAYAEEYYSLVADVYNKTHCDIIGHLDLVTKFNEGGRLFNTNDERYIAAYTRAIDTLLAAPAVFEINTGAMARGYRSAPYPDAEIVRKIAERGGEFTVSSDCHDKEHIDTGLKESMKCLSERGYKCYTSLDEILAKTRGKVIF